MADLGNLDVVKIFTLLGSVLGAGRAVFKGYQKVLQPEDDAEATSSTKSREPSKSPKEKNSLAPKTRPVTPHPIEEEDEVSQAKLCELEQQIHDLRVETKKMHLENLERMAEADRRYQNLTGRYQDIDRKIDDVGARLTELKDEQIEALQDKLNEIKHDLRQDLRDSRESLREVTQALSRALAQTKSQ
jgi:hypothetical protein